MEQISTYGTFYELGIGEGAKAKEHFDRIVKNTGRFNNSAIKANVIKVANGFNADFYYKGVCVRNVSCLADKFGWTVAYQNYKIN